MRLWSLHPSLLDAKGLVALWRETLLAQKVLQGLTKGYKYHPQLNRFKTTQNPLGLISCYLSIICDESLNRGYHFDRSKIGTISQGQIFVTSGQVDYEFNLLQKKISIRAPKWRIKEQAVHPLFKIIPGEIENWEKVHNE